MKEQLDNALWYLNNAISHAEHEGNTKIIENLTQSKKIIEYLISKV